MDTDTGSPREATTSAPTKTECTLCQRFHQSATYQRVSAVLHWRDLVESGLVFGIINFFFFLITIGGYTILTLFSYLLLTFMFISAVYVGALKLRATMKGEEFRNPFITRFQNVECKINRAHWEENIDLIVDTLNVALEHVRNALFCVDLLKTAKWIGALWLVSLVGRIFSGTALLYLATLVAFIWPRVYEEKQAQIDQHFALAKEKANFYYGQALQKLPPALKKKLE